MLWFSFSLVTVIWVRDISQEVTSQTEQIFQCFVPKIIADSNNKLNNKIFPFDAEPRMFNYGVNRSHAVATTQNHKSGFIPTVTHIYIPIRATAVQCAARPFEKSLFSVYWGSGKASSFGLVYALHRFHPPILYMHSFIDTHLWCNYTFYPNEVKYSSNTSFMKARKYLIEKGEKDGLMMDGWYKRAAWLQPK